MPIIVLKLLIFPDAYFSENQLESSPGNSPNAIKIIIAPGHKHSQILIFVSMDKPRANRRNKNHR